MSIMTILAHITAISVPLTAAYNAITAASIFFTIIDASKLRITGLRDASISLDTDMVLDNINFAYPSRHDVRVLNGLKMRIPTGRTTAIVGPSGSGKSTVVALIQRWYELGDQDPVAAYLRNGTISIGGRNLSEIDLYWWRSRIGLVQQEPFLFNDTIFKNVEYGLVGTPFENAPAQTKEQMVIQACKEAYADEFITRLPEVCTCIARESQTKLTLTELLYLCWECWPSSQWRTKAKDCHCEGNRSPARNLDF